MKKKTKNKAYEGEIKLERVIPYDWSKKQVHHFVTGTLITETISREELEKRYPNIETGIEPEGKK